MFGLDDALMGVTSLAGAGVAAVGIGEETQDAKKEQSASDAIFNLEKQQNVVRQNAANLLFGRAEIQSLRDKQRQAAYTNAATTSSGTAGFGVAGGGASQRGGALGQVSGQNTFNLAGLFQNQEISNTMFGLTNQITDQRKALSDAQYDMQGAQALTQLGMGLMGSASPFSKLVSGFSGMFQNT